MVHLLILLILQGTTEGQCGRGLYSRVAKPMYVVHCPFPYWCSSNETSGRESGSKSNAGRLACAQNIVEQYNSLPKDTVNARSLHVVQGQAHGGEIGCRLLNAQNPHSGEETPELSVTPEWESILAKQHLLALFPQPPLRHLLLDTLSFAKGVH